MERCEILNGWHGFSHPLLGCCTLLPAWTKTTRARTTQVQSAKLCHASCLQTSSIINYLDDGLLMSLYQNKTEANCCPPQTHSKWRNEGRCKLADTWRLSAKRSIFKVKQYTHTLMIKSAHCFVLNHPFFPDVSPSVSLFFLFLPKGAVLRCCWSCTL